MSCSYKGDRKDLLDGVRSSPVLDRVIFGITYPVKIRSETQKEGKNKSRKIKNIAPYQIRKMRRKSGKLREIDNVKIRNKNRKLEKCMRNNLAYFKGKSFRKS